ncbi:MAG: trimethylamine methyltransferase family protein [Deltaproteobacteria bacterium]|nr:trimethylamine methyltransferase family protein [Deltaproteobacteria bacterium]
MRNDFLVRCQPKLSLLDEEQKREIHLASLNVLERTGIVVHDEESLRLLREAGCEIRENKRVHIPPAVVEEALRSVPPRISIYDRDAKLSMLLEGRKSYFGTGSDTPNVIDFETGRRRKAVLADVERAALLADGLSEVDFVMSMGLASDVPAELSDRYHFAAMVSNSTKPIMFTAWSLDGLRDIYQMAAAVAGGEERLRRNPFIIHYAEPIAPFVHPRESLEKLLFCAEKGIPVEYHCISMGGTTAPATLAGSVVQANARMLSGVVIHQLKAKGAPLIVQAPVIFFDMRTSLMPYFGPEWCVSAATSKEMAMFYGIPTFGKAGVTDSKVFDQQAGIEIGMSILAENLVGNNLIHDMGYLESGLTSCLESLVVCSEVVSMARRIMRGIDLSPEHFCLDLMDRVGPEGNYLAEDHTARHFRREFWFPRILDRYPYEAWMEEGGKTLAEKAHMEAERVFREHVPKALQPEIREALDETLEKGKERA